jgi:hypothetical protein
MSLGLRHDVHQVVDAVVQIDVRKTGRSIERRVPPRGSRRGVARGIGLADVGFDFDDGAADRSATVPMDEDFANEVARDIERRSIVERPREFQDACPPRRRAIARVAALATSAS